MPSSTGIRMSISTTSGRSSRARRDGLAPVGRRADDLAPAGREHQLQPAADQVLVVGDQHASVRSRLDHRQHGLELEPAVAHPWRQRAAEHGDPLGHAEQAQPAAVRTPSDPTGLVARIRTAPSCRLDRQRDVAVGRTGGRWSAPPGRCGTPTRRRRRQRLAPGRPDVDVEPDRRGTPRPDGRGRRARAPAPGRARRRRRGSTCSSRPVSASARRPVVGHRRPAPPRRAPGRCATRSCAAAVCTTIALTEWAITSCSSRAIRSRSSRTACCWRSVLLLVEQPGLLVELARHPPEDERRHEQGADEDDVGDVVGRSSKKK